MNRRAFLGTLAGGLLAAPLAVEAQQAGKVYRIGYLFEQAQAQPPLRSHEESLRDLGYVEGRNLVVERRFAAFKYDRLPELAADLVRLKPDVIVTASNPLLTGALQHATMTVPIVFVGTADPVGSGLVTALARPGGNVTGLSMGTPPEFWAKQLEILNEMVPKLSRVAVLRQTGRTEAAATVKTAARTLGLTVLFVDVGTSTDIEGAFATMTRNRAGAAVILGGGLTYASRHRIADPGGAGQFGWCVMGGSALPLSLIRAGRAGDASAAVRAVLGVLGPSSEVHGVGIDSPLFWTPSGERRVDCIVREAIKKAGARHAGGTVQHVNSHQCCCGRIR